MLTWECDGCGVPVKDGEGHLTVHDGAAMRGHTVRWQVFHTTCDPHPERAEYTYDIERVRTPDLLRQRDEHLSRKRWIQNTDWASVVASKIA